MALQPLEGTFVVFVVVLKPLTGFDGRFELFCINCAGVHMNKQMSETPHTGVEDGG